MPASKPNPTLHPLLPLTTSPVIAALSPKQPSTPVFNQPAPLTSALMLVIQGLAGTTAASSASTSAGVANAFTTLDDSAGIQDLTRLTVGGEMTALGQSMNSLSADAESVVGAAIGQSQLSEKVEGLEADNISVSSDAGLQGLAQLDNTADAATTKGASTATADVQALQGADLNSLDCRWYRQRHWPNIAR